MYFPTARDNEAADRQPATMTTLKDVALTMETADTQETAIVWVTAFSLFVADTQEAVTSFVMDLAGSVVADTQLTDMVETARLNAVSDVELAQAAATILPADLMTLVAEAQLAEIGWVTDLNCAVADAHVTAINLAIDFAGMDVAETQATEIILPADFKTLVDEAQATDTVFEFATPPDDGTCPSASLPSASKPSMLRQRRHGFDGSAELSRSNRGLALQRPEPVFVVKQNPGADYIPRRQRIRRWRRHIGRWGVTKPEPRLIGLPVCVPVVRRDAGPVRIPNDRTVIRQ